MSVIEKTLIDALYLLRSYVRTFFRLIWQPNRVLNNLEPGFNGSVKFVTPILFFVFATFISFTIRVESHKSFIDIQDLSEYPSFIHNMTFLDVFLYSSPLVLIAYLILQVSTRIFGISIKSRIIYRGYILYSFGLAQLMIFLAMAVSLFIRSAPAFPPHDVINSILQAVHVVVIISSYFFLLAIPIRAMYVRFYKSSKEDFFKFLTIPILVIVFLYSTNSVGNIIEAYRPLHPDQDKLEFLTIPNTPYAISIQYSRGSDSTYSKTSLELYNPSNQIFVLPPTITITAKPRIEKNKPSIVHYIWFKLIKDNDDFLKPGELRRVIYFSVFANKDSVMIYRNHSDTLYADFRMSLNYYDLKRKWNSTFQDYYVLYFRRLSQDSLKRF